MSTCFGEIEIAEVGGSVEIAEIGGDVEIVEAGTIVLVQGVAISAPIRPAYTPTGIYALPTTPADPSQVQVFVNGAKQVYGIDYTIVGTVLTWTSPNLDLSSIDILEIYP